MKYPIFSLLLVLSTTMVHATDNPTVELQTNMGRFVIELNPEKAPKTVQNFLNYAQAGFYEGTVFHRVIPDFMVQGGGYTQDYEKKPTQPPVENEANNGLSNARGTVAMARTAKPNSATSQFFVNIKDNAEFLNYTSATSTGWGYAVFGKVIEGMDVIDKIQALETGNENGLSNVPLEPVFVQTVIIKNAPKEPLVTQKITPAVQTGSSTAQVEAAPDKPSTPDKPEPPLQ